MEKMISVTVAILLAGTVVVMSLSDANARHRGHRYGGGLAAGIIGGLIIGGAIANSRLEDRERDYAPPYRRDYGRAHVSWCYSRYRSYRDYDDTYQPYRGGRRYCRSPYN